MLRIFRAHYSVVPLTVPRGLHAQTLFSPGLRSSVGDRKICLEHCNSTGFGEIL
jgi:hypothetical protein